MSTEMMLDTNAQNRMNLIGVWLVGVALLAGCDNAADAGDDPAAVAEQVPAIKQVEVVEVATEPFTSTIQATGKALPVRESELSLEVSGTIEKVFVKEGDWVKKGKLLLRFDQKGFFLEVQHAKAALAAAETQANQLELEVNRITKLVKQGAAPSANLDQLQAQYDAAIAQKQMARVAVKLMQKQLADSVLRAPFSGMITEILLHEGEFAPAMPQTMLLRIVDTSSLEVQVYLPEELSGAVEVGDTAEVEVDGAGIRTTGEVIFVSNRLQSNSQTLEIKVKLANEDGKVKGGAFTRVSLTRRSLEAAILVPLKSVQRGDDGRPYVFIVAEGKAHRASVRLGEASGNRVLILDGLAVGQQVVVSGVSELEDGMPVAVQAPQG